MNPRPKRGEQVWFIGRNQDWWVPTDNLAGVVQYTPLRGELPVSIVRRAPDLRIRHCGHDYRR